MMSVQSFVRVGSSTAGRLGVNRLRYTVSKRGAQGTVRLVHAQDDEERQLHPTWSGLERRLLSRRPRPKGEGVPEGRSNLKPSEEEFWHAAGVYDHDNSSLSANSTILTGEATCARLSTVTVGSNNLPIVIKLYKTSISPALQVKGFCGAQVFSDKAAGTVHSLTLWESWGALATAVEDPRYTKAMRTLAGLIEGPPSVSDTELACCILPTTGGGDQPGDDT